MLGFSLWHQNALPTQINAEGQAWHIASDTKTILKILHMLSDDTLAPWHQTALLIEWFYLGNAPSDPIAPFHAFACMNEQIDNVDSSSPPDFDYQFDAMEIYASFVHLYRIDLLQTDLHWWVFRTLLTGCFCMDCPLSAKIRLRKSDPTKATSEIKKAIDHIQIPTKQAEEEKRINALINERLKQGLPIDDLLGR